MSTERSIVVRSIRRIVLQAPALRQAMKSLQNRGDQAASVGVGTSDADRDRICCDGSTSGNPNPGAETRDTSEGGEDGLDSDDPAGLSMGQGSLTGVTDCATGEDICFHGSDWIPPEGWESPTDPPEDPTWEEGVYWEFHFEYSKWENGARVELDQSSGSSAGRPNLCGFHSCPDFDCSDDDDSYVCREPPTGDTFERYEASRSSKACPEPGEDEEIDAACTDEPPLLENWPADSCANLAIKNGTIVGSKYDPENDGSYSKPRDEIELCDDAGNRILLRGSPSGGWKSIKSLDGDIDPDTGNGYLYGPSGKRIRQVSPSEFRDDTV